MLGNLTGIMRYTDTLRHSLHVIALLNHLFITMLLILLFFVIETVRTAAVNKDRPYTSLRIIGVANE